MHFYVKECCLPKNDNYVKSHGSGFDCRISILCYTTCYDSGDSGIFMHLH